MIKARNYLFLAAAATLLLAGCQNGLEEESKGSSNVVTIRCNAGSPSSSRIASYSTEFDQAHLFEAGDKVCVSTDGQEAVVYQCTNADYQTWDEADESKFLLWTQNEMTFKAYYPVTTGTSMTSFTLPADQSTTGKIALADYMTYEMIFSNEYSNEIDLDLERKTARVIVNIAGFTDQYDNDKKTVSNVRINSQYSTIDGYGDITAVTPYMQGTGGAGTSYTALVVPSYGDDGATFIQLTDGENNTLTVKGIPELREGYSYTFNLTVGKNTIQVQSVTVTDWTGETLTGGQAQEQAATALNITSPSVGQVIGSDGKNYAYGSLPADVTAVAMIAYLNGSNGLALALTDEGRMVWSTAQTTCAAHTPAFTGGTWKLATKDEWDNMISAAGSYTALRDGFSSVGGTNMQSNYYWSSTGDDSDRAWWYFFRNGTWLTGDLGRDAYVRACLVFEVSGSATVPEGAINGKFSVSDTKQVYFSKGNLRYASSAWSFFDNQYDYYTSYDEDAWDKFGWSTSTSTYGMNTSTQDSDYSGDFVDWGSNSDLQTALGTGWFTLSSAEWTYLFDERSASTMGGTENGRYAKARVNGVRGVILFPDTYTHPDDVADPRDVNTTDSSGWADNIYSSEDWTKMESAGCVFLPVAGNRVGSSVSESNCGYYWSATPSSTEEEAYDVDFDEEHLYSVSSHNRVLGYSVRLVQEVTE